jgi:SM-20-related protein
MSVTQIHREGDCGFTKAYVMPGQAVSGTKPTTNMPTIARRTDELVVRRQTARPSRARRFQLSRALDRKSLSRAFHRKGRLQVSAILRPSDAHALYQCLSKSTQWGLLLGSGPGIGQNYVSPEQCEAFTDAQYQTLHRMAHTFRGQGGSHLMGVRLIGQDAFDRQSDSSLLARFADWLDSRAFLNFVGDITGDCDIDRVSTQAMRFTVGHFSSLHADSTGEHDPQRVTCVFGFTPTWQRSWGGLLQFANKRGQLEDGFVPCFNSMTIFRSSLKHAVSVVTQRAQVPRYSIAASLFAEQESGSAPFPLYKAAK